MTLNKFIKALQALAAAGHGRCKVAVDKCSLWDGNDSWNICDIDGTEADTIHVADDDGGVMVNKDGTERMTRVVVLYGPGREPKQGK